jgi:cytochrome P450
MDEFLRLYPPVRTLSRTVMADHELGGCPMAAGQRALFSITGANRDETVFDRPLELDLDRGPVRHLSFGIGVHRCIGMHLARAEFTTVMRTILERMPDYRIDPAGLEPYARQGGACGYQHSPAVFTPGERRLVAAS